MYKQSSNTIENLNSHSMIITVSELRIRNIQSVAKFLIPLYHTTTKRWCTPRPPLHTYVLEVESSPSSGLKD